MKRRSLGALFWYKFKKNHLALGGGIVVCTLCISALFAPIIAPYDPGFINADAVLTPPSWAHPLSRIIWGGRISLLVGFVAVGITICIGMILGALAGYYGRLVDGVLMRFVDIMLCFPTFFLILAVIALLEPSIWNIMVVIGLTSWMGVARLVRAEFLSLKQREFVVAARAAGAGDMRINIRHILPNALAPVFVSAILGIGAAILTESALSFLGIGVQPPTPSWGNILTAGKDNIEIAYWLSFFPGLAILLTVLGYNLLGEGLRDALDPRIEP
jgi:peptide/nickel transport system permease protein